MRNAGRKHVYDYSHKRSSRPTERYVPEKSWKPQPSPRDELKKTLAERQDRFKDVFLKRQEEAIPVHEAERKYNLGNPELPAYKHKEEIQETVNNHQVTIIVGETGSGKSTQIPQFLLEAGYTDITMTQPRILAANGVAERIEDELHIFGDLNRHDASQQVGIHTSELNTVAGKDPSIQVVTDGLKLAQEYGERGEVVNEVLIIDEVHEWNTNIEILVASAKQLIAERPSMRLVVMSATMRAHDLSNYFADAVGEIPPIVEIEGRTFDVERLERPDSTVTDEVIESLEHNGDILVFVPGKTEIKDTIGELQRRLSGTEYADALILPLHSKMSKRNQDMVYLQPEDRKKIVVATGIAQTSITIPGITTVVDAGLERRLEYDEEEELGLQLHNTAQDTCLQRAGRAGRVEPGRYILTRLNEDTEVSPFISRDVESRPEIERTDLARNVLRTACAGKDFGDLDLFHPVKQTKIGEAKETLHTLGALDIIGDEDDAVTEIGHYMNRFPVRVSLGRMMAEAADKSENVRKYMAAIVSSVEAGNLQSFADDTENNWKQLVDGEDFSDMVAQLRIFSEVFNNGFTSQHETDVHFHEYVSNFDLDPKNVHRALSQYGKNAKHADVPAEFAFEEFTPPTTGELEEIYKCIYSGMADTVHRKVGREGFKPVYEMMGSERIVRREVSGRSVVDKPGDWVVGYPYHHEYYKDGERQSRNIIESVTKVVDPIDLASSSLKRLIKETPIGYKMRGGQLKQVNELTLYGQSIGVTEEKTPDFNKEVENQMLREVLAQSQALPTIKRLFDIKKASEELSNKDRLGSIKAVTQDEVIDIIRAVIREGEHTTVWEVENDLMVRDNIEGKYSLESMLDADEVERVILGSPDEIEVNGLSLKLYYVDGVPVAKSNPVEIKRNIYLDDGREVKFAVRNKGRSKGGRRTSRLVSGSELNAD